MRTFSRIPFLALALLGAGLAPAQTPSPSPDPARKAAGATAKKTPAPAGSAEPSTEREKTLYAMGAMLGLPVSSLDLKDDDLAWIRQGLSDSAGGRSLRIPLESFAPKVSDFTQSRLAEVASLEAAKDSVVVQREAAQPGTVRHPSGLLYRETKAGTKPGPGKTGKVFVAYTGTLTNGTVFDTSRSLGRPIVFDLEKVIPCWRNALPLMKAGGQARIVCPPSLAWGNVGNPPRIRPGATVIYDIELVEVLK